MRSDSEKSGLDTLALLEKARSAASRGLDSLDECLKRVDAQLSVATKYDTKIASHMAFLTEHLVCVMRELRQLEKHEAKQTGAMTPAEKDELVRAYLKNLSADRLAEFREFFELCHEAN